SFKLAALGFFASMVIYWSTYDIVYILFGPQWSETADILRRLAITIPLQMILSTTGGVFQAFGATKDMFRCGIFSSITNVTAILSGIYTGDIELLCIFLACSFALNYIQCFYILHKKIFKNYASKKIILLSVIVFSPYLNLGFMNVDIIVSSDYINAFISCTLISSAVFCLQAAIYFSYQKISFFKF
ncbi:MAG: lipopolysaccharide biosynthesis protein, partial [Psychromonas sp.]|nr:lipopolysaccharide biosynthesis protein [Psychromonas sp.]